MLISFQSCGKCLYDDYEELETGAAKRFQRNLRRQFHHLPARQHHGYQCNAQNICRSLLSVGMTLIALVKSSYEKFSNRNTELPTVELQQLESQPTVLVLGQNQPADQLFLLLCINDEPGGLAARGYQPAVDDIDSDRNYFTCSVHTTSLSVRHGGLGRLSGGSSTSTSCTLICTRNLSLISKSTMPFHPRSSARCINTNAASSNHPLAPIS